MDSWSTVHDVESYTFKPLEAQETKSIREIPQALYFASYLGFYVVVKELIKLGADVNACRGKSGSALAAACRGSHEKVVKLLIKSGANINDDGNLMYSMQNPLCLASAGGNIGLVRTLIEAGANCSMQGKSYRDSLKAATEQGKEQIVRYLIAVAKDLDTRHGDLDVALGCAAEYGHPHLVKMLIKDYGADPKAQSEDYANVLFAAALRRNDDERTMKMLIEDYGVDVNFVSKQEEGEELEMGHYATALQAAAAKSHYSNVKILLEAGANPKVKGGYYGNA